MINMRISLPHIEALANHLRVSSSTQANELCWLLIFFVKQTVMKGKASLRSLAA